MVSVGELPVSPDRRCYPLVSAVRCVVAFSAFRG